MNIQQLQYVTALAETQHFEQAAEKSFVSQSTLSTMILKLEAELGILLFDRKKKPVQLTKEGIILLEQIKKINKELEQLIEISKELKGEMKGSLSIAVIPTIAPFLLPLFLNDFASQYPDMQINVREQTTGEIIRQLKTRELDIGIASIPIQDDDIIEMHLYEEPFLLYDASFNKQKIISTEQINIENLCLLEEGHCMRTQILELCALREHSLFSKLNFKYMAGSIDSLLRFVKANNASTLLPYLSTLEMSSVEKDNLSQFAPPIPCRSVGLIMHRHFVKNKIANLLKNEIQVKLKELLPSATNKTRLLKPTNS
jgi:LysR family hydrogen peroxide-inducible transcriptional activator